MRERWKRGEINLKSCLLPHFPSSLIRLSFQAYPNSIGGCGQNQVHTKSDYQSILLGNSFKLDLKPSALCLLPPVFTQVLSVVSKQDFVSDPCTPRPSHPRAFPCRLEFLGNIHLAFTINFSNNCCCLFTKNLMGMTISCHNAAPFFDISLIVINRLAISIRKTTTSFS